MIAQERRGHTEGEPTAIASLLKKPGPGLFYIGTPVGKIRVTKKMLWKITSGALFVLLLNVDLVDGVEANRCFAILVFCTILWASEVSFWWRWYAVLILRYFLGYTVVRHVHVCTAPSHLAACHSE
jgi:hypothetical protein